VPYPMPVVAERWPDVLRPQQGARPSILAAAGEMREPGRRRTPFTARNLSAYSLLCVESLA